MRGAVWVHLVLLLLLFDFFFSFFLFDGEQEIRGRNKLKGEPCRLGDTVQIHCVDTDVLRV